MLSTEPNTTGPDPYFAFMDAQRATDASAFEARMAAKYPTASPIAQVIEFKPRQIAVPVHTFQPMTVRENLAA